MLTSDFIARGLNPGKESSRPVTLSKISTPGRTVRAKFQGTGILNSGQGYPVEFNGVGMKKKFDNHPPFPWQLVITSRQKQDHRHPPARGLYNRGRSAPGQWLQSRDEYLQAVPKQRILSLR